MSTTTEIIEKWKLGDHLTDKEMDTLIEMYSAAKEATLPFGERYGLVFLDASRNLIELEACKCHRMEHQ